MIRLNVSNDSFEKRRASSLRKDDIFEEYGHYFKVIKVAKVQGPDYHIQVDCIDREGDRNTFSYDSVRSDRVTICNARNFTWTFSFLIIDKSDNCTKEQMIINEFSKPEAQYSFKARCRKNYPNCLIKDVKVIMNQVQ